MEWTSDERLRHPSFLGLRFDKAAREVVRVEPGRCRRADRAGIARSEPKPIGVVLTIFLLVLLAVCACVAAIRAMFVFLGLDPMRTLVWLGLAEMPVPQVRRIPGR